MRDETPDNSPMARLIRQMEASRQAALRHMDRVSGYKSKAYYEGVAEGFKLAIQQATQYLRG